MLLALCFLLLPIVFSAVLNPFDRFMEPGFIQRNFLDYLPFHEQLKFMLTCRDYKGFLDVEYERLIKVIPNSHISKDSLKADIRKLYRYFKLEGEARKCHDEKFSLACFFQMIEGIYFTNPHVLSVIQKDNLDLFQSIFTIEYIAYVQLDRPHFPQISLNLLKSLSDPNQLALLIQNACVSPHQFDSFFKHLAVNIYAVKRHKLLNRIRKEYPRLTFSIALDTYQYVLKNAFSYLALESSIICLILLLLANQFVPSAIGLHSNTILLLMSLQKCIGFIYRMKYEGFAEYDHAAVRRFCMICTFIQRILNILHQYWNYMTSN